MGVGLIEKRPVIRPKTKKEVFMKRLLTVLSIVPLLWQFTDFGPRLVEAGGRRYGRSHGHVEIIMESPRIYRNYRHYGGVLIIQQDPYVYYQQPPIIIQQRPPAIFQQGPGGVIYSSQPQPQVVYVQTAPAPAPNYPPQELSTEKVFRGPLPEVNTGNLMDMRKYLDATGASSGERIALEHAIKEISNPKVPDYSISVLERDFVELKYLLHKAERSGAIPRPVMFALGDAVEYLRRVVAS